MKFPRHRCTVQPQIEENSTRSKIKPHEVPREQAKSVCHHFGPQNLVLLRAMRVGVGLQALAISTSFDQTYRGSRARSARRPAAGSRRWRPPGSACSAPRGTRWRTPKCVPTGAPGSCPPLAGTGSVPLHPVLSALR